MVYLTPKNLELGSKLRVVIYPSYGYWDRREHSWKLSIRGAIFSSSEINLRHRLFVRMLRRAMKARQLDLETELFRHRISGFVARQQRGVRVTIHLGSKSYRLRRRTARNGHFGGILRLSAFELHELQESGLVCDGWLKFDAVTRGRQDSAVTGFCQIIEPNGVSVISDIDDTIKHSGVGSRRELLANTFLREFESIPGMAQLYRTWEAQGANFHYVSSSPWQLYGPLSELCENHRFPEGTYHLRTLRLKDLRVLALLIPGPWGKRKAIRSILRAYPTRRFLLIGDTGQRDPELYGALARKHRNIARVFVRRLRNQWDEPARIRRAFRGLPPQLWRVFHEPDELVGESGQLAEL